MPTKNEPDSVGLSATLTIPELEQSKAAVLDRGELEQIQFLLGHASVQTTERYIGSKQRLQDAVNDRLGISVASDTA